jgi:hypothetical protein
VGFPKEIQGFLIDLFPLSFRGRGGAIILSFLGDAASLFSA